MQGYQHSGGFLTLWRGSCYEASGIRNCKLFRFNAWSPRQSERSQKKRRKTPSDEGPDSAGQGQIFPTEPGQVDRCARNDCMAKLWLELEDNTRANLQTVLAGGIELGAQVIGFKTWVSEQRGKVSPSTDVLASETCALSRSAARWPRQ